RRALAKHTGQRCRRRGQRLQPPGFRRLLAFHLGAAPHRRTERGPGGGPMSPVRRPAARPLAAVASILAALMILTGCGTPVPSPDPQPEAPETMPVLDKPRIERILNDLGETIDKADEKKDAELLQPRVADPALEIRAAEYALAKATDGGEDAYAPRTLIADPQVRIVSVSDSWPRTMMVVKIGRA